MKMIKYFVIFLILLLPNIVSAAFDPHSDECNLTEFAGSGYEWREVYCKDVNIDSTAYLYMLTGEAFESLNFSNIVINDFSFLSDVTVNESVNFSNCVLNLSVIPDNFIVEYLSFFESDIVNDDLIGLDVIDGLHGIYFEGCWVEDYSDLVSLDELESLYIINNYYMLTDLSFVKNMSSLANLYFGSSFMMLDESVFAMLDSSGVAFEPSEDDIMFITENIMASLEEFYDYELSAFEQIRKVTSYVVDNMNYNARGYEDDHLLNALSYDGTSRSYAALTAFYLQICGYTAFPVYGKDARNNDIGWTVVLYEGEWYAIDSYLIDTQGKNTALKNGEAVDNFMVPVDSSSFVANHIDEKKYYEKFANYSFLIEFMDGTDLIKEDELPINFSGYSFPTPTKEGYIFDGWYSDFGLTQKVTLPTNLQRNGKLFVKWAVDTSGSGSGSSGGSGSGSSGGSGTVNNPDTGIFATIMFLVPILSLFLLEYLKNKKYKKVYKI